MVYYVFGIGFKYHNRTRDNLKKFFFSVRRG